MKYLSFPSEYEKFPVQAMPEWNHHAYQGASEIVERLSTISSGILAFELYPGVDVREFEIAIIQKLQASIKINVECAKRPYSELTQLLAGQLTDDRVFGRMQKRTISDFYQASVWNDIQCDLQKTCGLRIVYGLGAAMLPHDELIYVDITRWEIQLRFRRGMSNFTAQNAAEDPLRKFKRGYFLEWRVADDLKRKYYQSASHIIGADNPHALTMITQAAFQAGLDRLSHSPFRLIPYFDPGIWGGQWMKEVCNLPDGTPNYAWSFDGVPEENALALNFGPVTFVFPAINLVLFRSIPLLGERVFARFGAEFPIRFDFLDTMDGGNLSLQVHPLTEYIREVFGMAYTQDESYYILDALPDSVVYLGVVPQVDPNEMFRNLSLANQGLIPFDDSRYVNKIPVHKHDHILIPAGTVHCSGKNTMVLEISATPYIFTFKLWDWGRVGMDGIPRPVHLEHGKQAVCFDRDTNWVHQNLINRFETISETEERTGLHEKEFIETRRLSIAQTLVSNTEGSVNVLNLVDGRSVRIESIEDMFPPYTIHYAETFIIPESVKKYRIVNLYPESTALVIKAYVRQ